MRIIDLTMPVGTQTPRFLSDPEPTFKQIAFIDKEGWNSHLISFHTHLGTHIDAPYHMLAGGRMTSDYPIEKLVGSAVLIDVRGQKEIDADLKGVEAGDIVILRTDHSLKYSASDYFSATPVVSQNLAEKIAQKKVSLVGIDAYTMDLSPFEIHKKWLSRDILILENLINLDRIKAERFNIFILPLKLEKMDGAPCRVIAQIP